LPAAVLIDASPNSLSSQALGPPATTAFRQQETDMRPQFRFLREAVLLAASGPVLLTTAPAWAAGSNMPWEQPLNQILQSVEGPVAKIIAVIIIVVTGLTLAFGDSSGGFRRLIQIVFGLSIAFAASSFFLSFFSFGGGVVI
jgi:type IV secretion system protein VirB2